LQYGLLFETVPTDWQRQCEAIGAVSLHCAAEHLSDAVLAEARSADVTVLCYTVNDADIARALFARGVTSIFSDTLLGQFS
jgi:glycerophosphoryl diester phosphodiesterase